jgi:hypothetical protein
MEASRKDFANEISAQDIKAIRSLLADGNYPSFSDAIKSVEIGNVDIIILIFNEIESFFDKLNVMEISNMDETIMEKVLLESKEVKQYKSQLSNVTMEFSLPQKQV